MNFFIHPTYNELYMKVEPRPCLSNDKFISDIYDRGAFLAVRVDTFKLTIVSNKHFEEGQRNTYALAQRIEKHFKDIAKDTSLEAMLNNVKHVSIKAEVGESLYFPVPGPIRNDSKAREEFRRSVYDKCNRAWGLLEYSSKYLTRFKDNYSVLAVKRIHE